MDLWVVYVLRSEVDGKYYIGSTSNLPLRLKRHNAGKVRSTKSRIPWKIVYTESASDRQSGYRRERQIKSYKSGRAFHALVRENVHPGGGSTATACGGVPPEAA
ncbi:MAG: GIY-YIG nuclease family protein [bacterium]